MRKFNFVIFISIGESFTLCKNYLYGTKIKTIMDIFLWVAPNSLISCSCKEPSRIIFLGFLLPPPHGKRDDISMSDVRKKLSMLRSMSVPFFWICLPGKRPHAGLNAAMFLEPSPERAGVHSCAGAYVCESVSLRSAVWQAQLAIILIPHSPVSFIVT